MFKRNAVVFTALFLLWSGAQAATFQIDPSHSEIGFRIRHLASKVRGRFNKFSGTIEFDKTALQVSKASAVVDASSIDTNVVKRDDHLRSEDFFNVAKFPTLTFESTGVKKEKDKTVLMGNFTLLGVTKPIELTVEVLGVQNSPRGMASAGFSATGKINRKDYGMIWNKVLDAGSFMLGDEVEILLEIEAVEKK